MIYQYPINIISMAYNGSLCFVVLRPQAHCDYEIMLLKDRIAACDKPNIQQSLFLQWRCNSLV